MVLHLCNKNTIARSFLHRKNFNGVSVTFDDPTRKTNFNEFKFNFRRVARTVKAICQMIDQRRCNFKCKTRLLRGPWRKGFRVENDRGSIAMTYRDGDAIYGPAKRWPEINFSLTYDAS